MYLQLKNHLVDWGKVIVNIHNVLVQQNLTRSAGELLSTPITSAGDLFKALCDITVKSNGINILSNVLYAVFHLKYLLVVNLLFESHFSSDFEHFTGKPRLSQNNRRSQEGIGEVQLL